MTDAVSSPAAADRSRASAKAASHPVQIQALRGYNEKEK